MTERRAFILWLAAVVILAAFNFFAFTSRAECAYCPSFKCYGSCTGGCVCIKGPGKAWGHCYSVQ